MIGGDVCGWLIVLLLYAAVLLGFGYLGWLTACCLMVVALSLLGGLFGLRSIAGAL